MSVVEPLRWSWIAREPPLIPCALAVVGAAVPRLGARLLALDDARLVRLSAVIAEDVVVVTGPSADLPWIDGAIWLGVDDGAKRLRVPTTIQPSVPIAWLERRFLRLAQDPSGPVAILPSCMRIVPLAAALPLDRGSLAGVAAAP